MVLQAVPKILGHRGLGLPSRLDEEVGSMAGPRGCLGRYRPDRGLIVTLTHRASIRAGRDNRANYSTFCSISSDCVADQRGDFVEAVEVVLAQPLGQLHTIRDFIVGHPPFREFLEEVLKDLGPVH